MLTKYINLFCWAFLFISLASVAQTTEKNEQTPDYALVFENSEVLSFHVTISPENWANMQPKLPAQTSYPTPERGKTSRRSSMFGFTFEYVKGTVKFGDEVYPDVGIRFKGNSSVALSLESLKKPYKFDFDEFVEGQTFHGFKKLNFSNSTLDPSLMREKLAYDLFRKAGVPVPDATFAKLYLTVDGKYENEYVGLYVMVEQVDERFLQNVFGNSKGLLVKRESLGDLAYLGDEWESYKDSFDLESKKNCSDTSRLIQFVKFLHQTTDEQFEEEIEGFLNVDSFLAWLAVNTLLTNLDSYAGMGHNYYLYLNEETGRFEFIPWDYNYAFGNFSLAGAPERRIDFDIYRPYTGRKILIERLLQVAKYQEQYLAHLRKLIEGPFHPDAMHAEIDGLYALIRTDAAKDTHNAYPTKAFEHSISTNILLSVPILSKASMAQPQQPSLCLSSWGSFRQQAETTMQVIGLKPFVTKRVESVRAQLAREKQGYVMWTLAPPSAPPSISSNTRLQQALAIKPTSFETQYALVNAQTVAQTNDVIEPAANGENLHVTIHLKSGGVLEGQIIGSDENTITIQPYSGGVITISRNYIEEIKTYRLKVNDVLKRRAQALRPKAEAEIKVAPGPLNAGKVAGEIIVGALAGGALGVAGGFIGVGIDMGLFDYYMEGLLGAFIGGSIGYTIGSSLGVYWVGSIGDETGYYLATLGGSILGFATGVAGAIALSSSSYDLDGISFFAGPLIGAVIGFNATRKKKWSFEPGDALLNFSAGKLCLAVPSISLRLRHTELIQRVDLVKVGF